MLRGVSMLRYKMLKNPFGGVNMLRYVSLLSLQGGQHVPEWQAIQTNQSTLLFRILPVFRGSTSSGLSIPPYFLFQKQLK